LLLVQVIPIRRDLFGRVLHVLVTLICFAFHLFLRSMFFWGLISRFSFLCGFIVIPGGPVWAVAFKTRVPWINCFWKLSGSYDVRLLGRVQVKTSIVLDSFWKLRKNNEVC
jgi:hypothetical protein